MSQMNKTDKVKHALAVLQKYVLLFVIIAFAVTCCMLLFLHAMQSKMGIILTRNDIQSAARLTFVNVVLLSLLCTLIDVVRTYFMVDRPVKKIVNAAEKIMEGDLSVRIEKIRTIDIGNGFNTIIEYFNKMAEELSGIETLRTDFISNVSHELKTPLSVMQNYGMILQQPDISDEQRMECAKAITDSSRSLANMITNILKLNKLENQHIYPATVRYNVGEQLCECLLGFEEIWEKKNIEIETDIEENVMITTDPELLTLVWNNLFSNAIKFTDEGGYVRLTLKSGNGRAVISVSDTGCGISQEVGSHMFEKFYQGDTSHATKGNGLGLALVKRVIDIVDGDISVSSKQGKGSTFTVTLKSEKSNGGNKDYE